MELTPVDDTFDEAIYAVVLTGKASETTDTDDLFQTSFGTLLDGSEFMDGIFEKHENDKVEEEEKDKMESAIRMGMKMARRCSCPSVGSYKPFDAADPSTWNKKRSKPPRQNKVNRLVVGRRKKNTPIIVAPRHRWSARALWNSTRLRQEEVGKESVMAERRIEKHKVTAILKLPGGRRLLRLLKAVASRVNACKDESNIWVVSTIMVWKGSL